VKGPRLRIVASCDNCEFVKVTPYRVQGDSGRDVECTHPDAQGYIGESRFDSTPNWCALLETAVSEFAASNPIQCHLVNQ
jgi:hypothetical protein